jgi:AraC family transcriptional regulator
MQCDGLGGQMYAESLANLFTIHLLRHYCTTQPHLRTFKSGLPRQQLQQVIDYMQAHLDQSLGLNELANVLGMNSHYFWKQLKQSMGMPPHQYLIQCRVDRAKQLLKQKNLPLTEIAAQCGFADQSHLNRHFRKRLGMAPSTYRNSLR